MFKWLRILTALGVAGLAFAFALGLLLPHLRIADTHLTVDINDPELIQRGEYVARTADCYACHTTLNGDDYAGGLPMLTPLGDRKASCRERGYGALYVRTSERNKKEIAR